MEKLKSMWIGIPDWQPPLQVDDFLIAIGKTKSNSVYHVSEVTRKKELPHLRMTRYYYKAYKSDLLTALRREDKQKLIPFSWLPRTKKNTN